MLIRRRKLLLVIVAAAVMLPLLGVGTYLLVPPKPGVSLENFRRLHRGMNQDQVDAILGSKGKPTQLQTSSTARPEGWYIPGEVWEYEAGTIEVYYEQGIAQHGQFKDKTLEIESLSQEPEGILRKLRRWFFL